MMRIVGAGATAVRAEPAEDSQVVSQLAPGDEFAVLDIAGGWAWGYRRSNHHVGYVPAELLGEG